MHMGASVVFPLHPNSVAKVADLSELNNYVFIRNVQYAPPVTVFERQHGYRSKPVK
jgi:hypothetical protein